MKLSVVLAVKNEEENLDRCLTAVKDVADEIVIVDEFSSDKTLDIAKKFKAIIYQRNIVNNFHENKQFALQEARGEWILQLDADEVVTSGLAKEINKVINGEEIIVSDSRKKRLFRKHQKAIESRDGEIGSGSGEIVAYFIPRVNMFLGKPLRYAGVYPDPAIRLVKRGKGYFPAKSVHELMKVEGRVGWLSEDMEHWDSPTLKRYLRRANRYTTLTSSEYEQKKLSKNLYGVIYYSFIKPGIVFCKLYFRYKGIKDGIRGFLWSSFSALHFPIAYYKYYTK